jgi:hypothetical protein
VNVVCLGADIVGPTLAIELLGVYLAARFDPAPDFVRRVALLAAMDDERAGLSTTSSTSVATSASAESPLGEPRKNVFDRW